MLIRDIFSNDIQIDDQHIKDIIRTYEFQRLRKIRQLGLTFLVFPGAEHTRFMHSIGVYNLACELLANFEMKKPNYFTNQEKDAIKIASLLHDLGHGPLSHTSENFFNYHHEQFSIKIIKDQNTQINQVLRKYNPKLIDEICLIIAKKHAKEILNQILSSTIDIDRMDYLVRDSYHVGVIYGALDYSRILKIVDIEDDKIVFLEKGVQTLEDFIFRRYHMFGQVYLNAKTIGYEELVGLIIKRIDDLLQQDYQFKTDLQLFKPFLAKKIAIKDFLKMNDFVLLALIESFAFNEQDQMLRSLSMAIVNQKSLRVNLKVDDETNYYVFKSQKLIKQIYSESILIKNLDGTVERLEDKSQLVNFIKNELKIIQTSNCYYLKKNEN